MTIENAVLLQVEVISWFTEYGTSVASIVVTAAASLIAYFTLKFQKDSHNATASAEEKRFNIIAKAEKDKVQLAALAEAFKVLNDVKHREARKVLYNIEKGPISETSFDIIGINKLGMNNELKYEGLKSICRDIVRSDFNEIGTLIHYDLLDGKIFIEEYYWVILKIWSLLKTEIVERRKEPGPPNYMEHLEHMEKKAAEFAKEKYPGVYNMFYSDKDSN